MDQPRSERPEMVVLHGLSVPRESLRLLLELEEAGFTFSVSPDDLLEVRPSWRLTPELSEQIRRHRDFLIPLVRHSGPAH